MKFLRRKGYTGSRILFNQYKASARKRNLPFELEFEQFLKLTSSKCFYCGISPFKIIKGHLWCSTETRENGKYKFNGIDRMDNSIGYVIGNCVSCCIICNKAKRMMTVKEFLAWVRIVYETRN